MQEPIATYIFTYNIDIQIISNEMALNNYGILFKQLFSSIPLAKFYCFKDISDLIITKKTASTNAAESPIDITHYAVPASKY